ncbi:MAG TPA: hypothetical protein VFN26_07870 [Candidatus Acidoferrum sp.]|nr:hypothetical protein [Candidatus Acidoferrum sp.]
MKPEQFSEFRHEAVHELMRLNDLCEKEFRISSWPRWEYDFERATLTFSQESVPKVLASIQVVGTTSISRGTWLWGWANESLPSKVTSELERVRRFGKAERIAELTEAELPDDEYLGWEMTAIAARLLDAKGGYRCPGENGFVYVLYSSIGFAQDEPGAGPGSERVECSDHGSGFAAYACEHLVSNPAQVWFTQDPDEEHKWPDAWCGACDVFFQEQGEWNENNESKMKIRLLCHHCYERLRSQES